MNSKVFKALLFAMAIITAASAQSVVTVTDIVITTVPSTSYVVNRQAKIVGSSGGIYIDADPSFFIRLNPAMHASPSPHRNFVRTQQLLPGGEVKNTSYQYVDGLGQNTQTIKVGDSPGGKDVVSFVFRDKFQREIRSYLPFVSGAGGAYHDDPVTDVVNFYAGSGDVVNDREPYTIHDFESSPRNRTKHTVASGWNWHHDAVSIPSTKMIALNRLNEVLILTLGNDGLPIYAPDKFYPENTLLVEEKVDENGLRHKTFRDFRDLVVLSKVGTESEWHETYYLYDVRGNLRLILPPDASRQLAKLHVAGESEAFVDHYCFQYEYDARGRQTGKKNPGSGWTFKLYDNWDRTAFIQDARQRIRNEWIFTKYDIHNRPVMSGTIRSDQQTLQNGLAAAVNRYEERVNSSVGYTNKTFPTHAEADLLTIDYYDCYAFLNYSNWDAEGMNFHPVFETGSFGPDNIFFKEDPTVVVNPVIRGYKTGSKIRVLDGQTSQWLNSVIYYNKEYRVAQTITENHLGGIEVVSTVYNNHSGTIQSSKNVHTTRYKTVDVQTQFEYDHGDRLTKMYHLIDGNRVLMVQNRYNELGQRVEKNIHSVDEGETFLQSQDFRFNIQGWPTHFNNAALVAELNDDVKDFFGMELVYHDTLSLNNGAFRSDPHYNGNVSAVRWATSNGGGASTSEERAYGFRYDAFKRFREGYFAYKGVGDWSKNAGLYNEGVKDYSHGGNIGGQETSALLRNGMINGKLATIDQLSYRYQGNKLMNIKDSASAIAGFIDKPGVNRSVDEYSYDENGNATEDFNRSISSIKYNDLGLVKEIQIFDAVNKRTDKIVLTYDASGNKLRREIYIGDKLVWKTEHVNGVQYDNGSLSFFPTSEGRAVYNGSSYDYEYFLKDFQNNIRVVCGLIRETQCYKATMESTLANLEIKTYGFRNIAETRSSSNNITVPSELVSSPSRSARVNGFSSETVMRQPIGPAKKLTVSSGDVAYSEVYARYNSVRTTSASLAATVLAGHVSTTFNVTSAENPILWSSIQSSAPLAAASTRYTPEVPRAYLTMLFFDNNHTFKKAVTRGITSKAYKAHEKLNVSLKTDFDGYALIYVATESNESSSVDVFFDDLYIIHEKNKLAPQVIQSSDYYPFGLPFNVYNLDRLRETEIDTAAYEPVLRNRIAFQGQEVLKDLNLDWSEFKYRMYDPTIGRFGAVDPLSHDYVYNSPYAFSENVLINGVELEGAETATVFELMKHVSPIALNVHYSAGTHETKIGYDISIGLPKWLPFSYRYNYGQSYNMVDILQKKSLVETRGGHETSYLGVVSNKDTKYSSGYTSQNTGSVTFGTPILNVQYENDFWFGSHRVALDRGGFHYWGDSGDKFRTAAVSGRVGLAHIGMKLATGNPGPPDQRKNEGIRGGLYGVYEKHTVDGVVYDPNEYRLGVLYGGSGPFRLGAENEGFRHIIQNRLVHDGFSESPWFEFIPRGTDFYFSLTNGTASQW
jgi:RHS repeat-associated protein